MKRHAILLSGGVNFQNNHARYKNDLELAYQVLVEDCGFEKEDIKVFYANGIAIKYASENIVAEEATKENIIKVLEEEKSSLDINDKLVLIISNHGGDDHGGYINLWGSDILDFRTLSNILEQISASKILLLGECYAGNILQFDINNSCIMTANMQGLSSYASPYNAEYDEFFYHFFSYIHGSYPDGIQLNQQGENNIKKAFQYAVDMDVFAPGSLKGDFIRNICQKNIIQIPQMKSNIDVEISL